MPNALSDLKVLDFSWVSVGPLTTKKLADFGATVIRVESSHHIGIRIPTTDVAGRMSLNRCYWFNTGNTNKLSLGCNMGKPEGKKLIEKLISTWQPDVVIHSWAGGVAGRLGLDYESVRSLKPDVIYVSTNQYGETGPHASQPGYGTLAAGLAGFNYVTGWPDRTPVHPYGAYSDYINPQFNATLILAAWDYKRRTGKGQWLDLSQVEVAIQFLSPVILDYTANGRIFERRGNRDSRCCPHGCYPCRGESRWGDRWCVIAVCSDEEWHSFGKATGDPEWVRDPNFATFKARKENEDELDRRIAEWTTAFTPEEVMYRMQAAGVPAGVVQNYDDLHRDPQLKYRDYFPMMRHKEMGLAPHQSEPFRLSETPAATRGAPCLGEHTEYICKQILGISDDELADLLAAEVVEIT